MISTSKVQLHHKIGRKIKLPLSHTLIHTIAALQERFLQILFAFQGFSEGLDHFLEKVGQMYAFCGGRETHVLKNGELLKKE